ATTTAALTELVQLEPLVETKSETPSSIQPTPPETGDKVTTTQGDLLIGKVIGIADGTLRFTAPHYEREVVIFAESLKRVQLAGKSQESGPMEVGLINKDYIRGKVVAITPESVVIETQTGGMMTISRKVVSSITLAATKRTLLASNFGSGNMEPWKVRAGKWSLKDKQLVLSSGGGGNQAVYAELDQTEALTFVAKVKAANPQQLQCSLVAFADDIEGEYGRNSVFAQFQPWNPQIGYCQNGASRNVSPGRRGMWGGPVQVDRTAREQTLRLAYDPATGKATMWLDSNRLHQQTIKPKLTKYLPTKGKYVIFTARQPCQISYLRVLRGIVPPSQDQGKAINAQANTHTIEFTNEDSVSATAVSMAKGIFVAQTAHGQLRCPLEEVTSVVFATKGQEKPRRDKRDVLVETAASRLTIQFDKLNDEYLLGSSDHLGQVKILRTAVRSIRFHFYK
ncbi:hypothetical protein LCGC14_2484900, partial [marine sediment metagenome]